MQDTFLPVSSKGPDPTCTASSAPTRKWRLSTLRTLSTALLFSAATFTFVYRDAIQESIIPSWLSPNPLINAPPTDWSSYAYVQSVTSEEDVCGSLMLFESLSRLDSKADRVLLYPYEWNSEFEHESSAKMNMLLAARDKYNVKLQPSAMPHGFREHVNNISGAVAKMVHMKFTYYHRVIVLDTAGTIFKSLDELFFLPSAPVAMPSAYWLPDAYKTDKMSAAITVVEPSMLKERSVYDVVLPENQDEVNTQVFEVAYGTTCMAFEHRPYLFPAEELKRGLDEHGEYLDSEEEWDVNKVMGEAKYIYFSDRSVPKPWLKRSSEEDLDLNKPTCYGGRFGPKECRDKEVLRWLYKEYAARRKDVCGSELL